MLIELAQSAPAPVITFTDGPMELWGAKDADDAIDFQKSLAEYLDVLAQLHELQVITAGYVDRPSANLVVRLLEVAITPQNELAHIKDKRPLDGVTDLDLYHSLLNPGERSAVFAIQSKSAENYQGPLALHFFYLNVGRPGASQLARVELPAWVAADPSRLDQLHATLISQCRLMGSRPYPYLLHRAHETAVVTLDDKTQVTQMILAELRSQGIDVGDVSNKQYAKKSGCPNEVFAMTMIEIGRLLRAGTAGFVVGCRVNQLNAPAFGALVSTPLDGNCQVYGLIYDMHIDDDGLVRQLVTAESSGPRFPRSRYRG